VLLEPGRRQTPVVAPEVMTSSDLPGDSSAVGHGDGRTYALTDSGVVFTDDGGRTWSDLDVAP
jgi:photosystem II stability/assembly factor-like uncharacterized protein